MELKTAVLFCLCAFLALSCTREQVDQKPNIILIMADDMGYECLSSYGSLSYRTPVLDSLAAAGIRFANCVSQPLCTPSRVKIMTGLYNYRNYERFGYLNEEQYTFGNLFSDAGYATCIAGKWQLNGLAYKDSIPSWDDAERPVAFGFEEYCLWQLTKTRGEGERYADPLIEQNGQVLDTSEDDYGPDIFADFILDFIERKKDEPFFVYYPMVLVHDPFVPTPDSDAWADKSLRYKNDTTYFRDMVAYTDKIVGKITAKLRDLGLDENTLLLFTGDNGTHVTINTRTVKGSVQGAKGNTIDAGTHVPLIAYWPAQIRQGMVYDGLIEFSDFFPTFSELTGHEQPSDGESFLPLLQGNIYAGRETAFVHYDPRWGKNVNKFRNRFVRSLDHKLYQDGKFYDLAKDVLEKHPLEADSLTGDQQETRSRLESVLSRHPAWE